MPAFHRERIATAVQTMAEETDRATAGWKPGDVIDIYEWMRNLAMRIAMRALFGLDPDDRGRGAAAAEHFERALSFYGTDFHMRLLRGPGSPWRQDARTRVACSTRSCLTRSRAAAPADDLDHGDILGMLLAAEDEDGSRLSDQEVRDQLMTLLFAGHDTSTSTLSFLMYELARHPHVLARLYEEQDRVLGDEVPTYEQIERGLPELGMALDETLRLYPPAWIGSRRAVRDFEFGGYEVPRGAWVHYCSWASHRLPEVFPEPEAFIPERFTPERKASLPKGAYVPFGAGSRICIGKRFGQTEVLLVAALLLRRFRLELLPGRTMTVRQMPTLSPREPLLMRVRERGVGHVASRLRAPARRARIEAGGARGVRLSRLRRDERRRDRNRGRRHTHGPLRPLSLQEGALSVAARARERAAARPRRHPDPRRGLPATSGCGTRSTRSSASSRRIRSPGRCSRAKAPSDPEIAAADDRLRARSAEAIRSLLAADLLAAGVDPAASARRSWSSWPPPQSRASRAGHTIIPPCRASSSSMRRWSCSGAGFAGLLRFSSARAPGSRKLLQESGART